MGNPLEQWMRSHERKMLTRHTFFTKCLQYLAFSIFYSGNNSNRVNNVLAHTRSAPFCLPAPSLVSVRQCGDNKIVFMTSSFNVFAFLLFFFYFCFMLLVSWQGPARYCPQLLLLLLLLALFAFVTLTSHCLRPESIDFPKPLTVLCCQLPIV